MHFRPLLVGKGVVRWVEEGCKRLIIEEKEQKAVLFLAMIIQKSRQDLSWMTTMGSRRSGMVGQMGFPSA